jgi:hypothetical protein
MKILGAVFAVLLFGACSSTGEVRSPTLGVPRTTVSPAPTVDPVRARFHLTVSNQSFREQRVTITVTIDGRRLIAQDFDVEGQHNFVGFAFDIGPGRHVLIATGASRTTHRETFELPASGKRYGVLQYWNEGTEAPYFSWSFHVEPPGFA